jgi:hypothetical protein
LLQEKKGIPYKRPIIGAVVFVIIAGVALAISAISIITYKFETYHLGLWSVIGLSIIFSAYLIVCAIALIISALKFRSNPVGHSKWGIIILIFSLITVSPIAVTLTVTIAASTGPIYDASEWFVSFLAYIANIGSLLGIVGAYNALSFKPKLIVTGQPSAPQYIAGQQIRRVVCPRCGLVMDEYVQFCPDCGNQMH